MMELKDDMLEQVSGGIQNNQTDKLEPVCPGTGCGKKLIFYKSGRVDGANAGKSGYMCENPLCEYCKSKKVFSYKELFPDTAKAI